MKKHLLLLGVVVIIASCAPAADQPATGATAPAKTESPTAEPTPVPDPVTIEYIGHSCVLIVAPDGTRVVTDPYGDYASPPEITFPDGVEADVVTISHFHPDHSNIEAVEGDPQAYYQPGVYRVGEVKITGLESDHGGELGTGGSNANTAFVFEIDQITIVHMGAAGLVSQEEILEVLADADVVFIDIQGDTTHPPREEVEQMVALGAGTIVPTHYSLSSDRRFYGAPTLDEFLAMVPEDLAVADVEGSQLEVTSGMPTQVVVLTPSALGTQE